MLMLSGTSKSMKNFVMCLYILYGLIDYLVGAGLILTGQRCFTIVAAVVASKMGCPIANSYLAV